MNAIDFYIEIIEQVISAMNSSLDKAAKISLLYMVLDDVTRELTFLEKKEASNG